MEKDITFHYPHDLLSLLIDAIPALCRSKKDVILFFKGAGIAPGITNDLVRKINNDKDSIRKHEIVRTVLTRLNEKGEATLRERREVLKRVVEFEDFSACWPSDQLKAKGLVAEIRRVINVKDAFTRMDLEREEERKKRQGAQIEKRKKDEQHREDLRRVRAELLSLFKETDPRKRGTLLEVVLNKLFEVNGFLVQEAFTLKGTDGEGIIEQIDGVVALDGSFYLVEMKWWDKPLGKNDVTPHLLNVYHRGQTRGIFISASGYTEPAITLFRDALQKSIFVLCKLEEIVFLLEKEGDLKELFREKIKAAAIHKNPLYEPLSFNAV
ncbi:MAG TPA: restriction endonuclease [Pyrinomonadaceae bacterium]|nr:restriction endonuclease [Pyrinomonadaceae bacterium]